MILVFLLGFLRGLLFGESLRIMGQIVVSMQSNIGEVFSGRRKRRRSTDSTASQEERDRAQLEAKSPKK